MRKKGFTFIELMIVITIMSVLGALTIAGFSNYNQVQVLSTTSNDIVTMLNVAKSRAQSQVKLGANCSASGRTLVDYRVDISKAGKSYSLNIDCQDSNIPPNTFSNRLDTKKLPQGASFTASSSFSFPVLSGGVEGSGPGPWTIIVSISGKSKTITITALGGINVQ
jgi:prepilin-type N-terminal cleavage/methylation domain-containing protein